MLLNLQQAFELLDICNLFFHTSLFFISIEAGMGWKQLGVVANHRMDLFYGM